MDNQILINFSGWLLINKEDLKVMKIENQKFVDVDTTDMTTLEVVELLSDCKTKAMLKSFRDTIAISTDVDSNDLSFDVDEP